MKNFEVMVDITMSKNFWVDAENEKEAERKVNDMINSDPAGYASRGGLYVKHEITNVDEEV